MWQGGEGPALSVTMTLIFPKIVWTCPLSILYHRKMNAESISCPEEIREYIMSRANLSGVYHFYNMAVTAATVV